MPDCSANAFCSVLEPATRERLCAGCRIRSFPKGQVFPSGYWHKGMALILSGLLAAHTVDERGRVSVQSLGAAGDIIDVVGFFADEAVLGNSDRETSFVVDGAVALFDHDVICNLMENDFGFFREVARSCMRCCAIESHEYFLEVAGKDAHAAVAYVLRYAREHGIDFLTHEQIAFLSNLRRPTVTKIMHDLTLARPDLFGSLPA